MSNAKKRINPAELQLWEGCDGAWYTHAGKCAICGKTYRDHSSGRSANPQPERVIKDEYRAEVRIIKDLPPIAGRLRVVFTRGYRSTPLDYDNLVGGFKPLRDEIATLLGRDDAERYGIDWEYKQEKGSIKKIEIFAEDKQ